MSFRLKLVITITLLLATVFGIGGTVMIGVSFYNSLESEEDAALESFQFAANMLSITNSMGNKNYKGLKETLSQMEQQSAGGWSSMLLHSEDSVVYRYGDISQLQKNELQAVEGVCTHLMKQYNDAQWLYVATLISAGEDSLILEASYDISKVFQDRQMQMRIFVIIYIVLIVFGFTVVALMLHGLTKPLHRLTVTARKISNGDLSSRSAIGTSDEFGHLSRSFDAMAESLQNNIQQMQDTMRRQERFMGAFAHELKTPMTSIIGYADLLRQDSLEHADRIRAANYIFGEGQRLEKLSFQLLDLLLMEKDSVKLQKISIALLLEQTEKTLLPAMVKRNVRLVCRTEGGIFVADPDLMKSLLYNLIDNASKAIEKEGLVVVVGKVADGALILQITDNGRGMTEDALKKVTEPFYRVDKSRSRSQGGAGLGLSLCSDIVALHHGSMTFSSRPGSGTTVTVCIPALGGEVDETV